MWGSCLLGEKCYKLGGRRPSERLHWDRASERCKSYGGNLVSIQSQEEQGKDSHFTITNF